jgi:hypothetical protein
MATTVTATTHVSGARQRRAWLRLTSSIRLLDLRDDAPAVCKWSRSSLRGRAADLHAP